MNRLILLSSLLLVAPLGAMAASQGTARGKESTITAPATTLTKEDRRFVDEAAEGGLVEVRLGQLAVKQAVSPEVKTFGQRMIDDHTKANERLQKVATDEGFTLAPEIGKHHQALIDRLAKETGTAFDREYVKQAVEDHDKDVKAFEHAAKNAKDPGVKDFAATTLPIIQEHLAQAKALLAKVK